MKKSSKVTLTLVATLGLAACNRTPDPCNKETYNDAACLQAVKDGGYYWGGSWVPVTYYQPYPYYYDSYRSYVDSGGHVNAEPSEAYSRSGAAGVTRGGFGETGAGHGAGE